jgi:hypothetical protein
MEELPIRGVTFTIYEFPHIQGLIGFDVGTGSRFVRPELLRLLKRGTQRTADGEFALAA